MNNPYAPDPSMQPQQPQNTVGPAATMAPQAPSQLGYQQAMAQALQNSGTTAASAPNLSGVMQMMQMMKKPAAPAPGPAILGADGGAPMVGSFQQTGSLS